jgi:HEAT repeat protein/S1-C subfamily serine protease
MPQLRCPKCGTPLVLSGSSTGVTACPKCQTRLRVTAPGEKLAPPPPRIPASTVAGAGRGKPGWLDSPWLYVGSGSLGLVFASLILLTWAFLRTGETNPGPDDSPPSQTVAQVEKKSDPNPPFVPPRKGSSEKDGSASKDGTPRTDGASPASLHKDGSDPKAAKPELVKISGKTPTLTGEQVYRKLLKSCAWIVVFDTKGRLAWTGSGSVIDITDRLVITNQHVANSECAKIGVVFPIYQEGKLVTERDYYFKEVGKGNYIPARLVKEDRKRDLAVIQLDRLPERVAALRLSARSVSPGQQIHLVGGAPRGTAGEWVNTQGSVRQVCFKRWKYEDKFPHEAQVIESQLPSNPGDSGGPVVDNRCILVGVHAMGGGGLLTNAHIDISSVKDFLQEVFRGLGKQWKEPEDDPEMVVDEADLKKLTQALREGDAKGRKKAALLLADLGPAARKAIPELLALLRNAQESAEVRAAAERALGEAGTPEKGHVPLLIEALGDTLAPEGRARIYAADALGRLGRDARKAMPALIKALEATESDVRRSAATALGKIGIYERDEAFIALLRGAKDREREVRVASGHGLLNLGRPDRKDAPILVALLADRAGPREGRVYAAWGLGQLGEAHVPALADALSNDTDSGVLVVALEMVGGLKVKSKEVGAGLARCVTHSQPRVRLQAAFALGQIGFDGTTLPAILKAFNSPDAQCRTVARKVLPALTTFTPDPPQLGLTKENVGELKGLLGSADASPRQAAAYMLGTLRTEAAAAVPELRTALLREQKAKTIERSVTKLELLAALAEVGPAAQAALPELLQVMDEDYGSVSSLLRGSAALAVVAVAPDDKDACARAYTTLARSLEIPEVLRKNLIVNTIHERAKRALTRGGTDAAQALRRAYTTSFVDQSGQNRDKHYARCTTLQVLTRIGRKGQDPRVFQFLKWVVRNPDYDDVRQAAREASAAVYPR